MSRFRSLLPAVVMVSWLIIGGLAGPYAGKLAEVQTNDRAAFLPNDAESTRVTAAQRAVQDDDPVPAIVVLEYGREVTGADLAELEGPALRLADISGVAALQRPQR